MKIFLVRIVTSSDGTLRLERKPHATTDDDYIAISHVWGDPATIQLTSIPSWPIPVTLSPGKLNILTILCREDICDDDWFWMDLFCIDQDPNSAISITDQLMAIPNIYKSARCVKVLIESQVCRGWRETVARVVEEGVQDMSIFREEELRHCRKCPHMMFLDPWFDRLWTRQEGLYSMSIQVVLLNLVDCVRLKATPNDVHTRWASEAEARGKRASVETFLIDKLAYHGIPTSDSQSNFQMYLDLVYKGKVIIENWGGSVGPHSGYLPIGEAWRSGRLTTKERDYVLAVFPDVAGYYAPQGARKMTFRELMDDALRQVTCTAERQDREGKDLLNLITIAKVPWGMVEEVEGKQLANQMVPWIVSDPANVTEAFDTFLAARKSESRASWRHSYTATASTGSGAGSMHMEPVPELARTTRIEHSKVILENVDFSRGGLQCLVYLWETTADTIKHMAYAAPFGPCVQGAGIGLPSPGKEHILHRYFAHMFAKHAIATYVTMTEGAKSFSNLRPHGTVNIDNMDIPDTVFEYELKRFMICLICGTSLATATKILEHIEFRAVGSGGRGKLLALINKRSLRLIDGITLFDGGNVDHQGLQIQLKGTQGQITIGRTWIPRVTTT